MISFGSKMVLGIAGGAVGIAGIAFGLAEIIKESSRYDRDGFDRDGFDRDGYNRSGFNRQGRDRQGYNAAGYNLEGFNRLGFDQDGFDRQGYDANGYDHTGRDKRGYDRDGFDADGYDRFGRDADGFRRNGFGLDGFNRAGLDWQGYGRDRYNDKGLDRAGHCRQYYSDQLEQLRLRLDEAYQQLKDGGYRYAVYDARVVMDEALRMLVQHEEGRKESDDTMLVNLKICERKQLLKDSAFLDRLHGVRRICNSNGHELDAEDTMSHNKVHFVVMQIRDLLDEAEQKLVNNQ